METLIQSDNSNNIFPFYFEFSSGCGKKNKLKNKIKSFQWKEDRETVK